MRLVEQGFPDSCERERTQFMTLSSIEHKIGARAAKRLKAVEQDGEAETENLPGRRC